MALVKRIKYVVEGNLLRSRDIFSNGRASFIVFINPSTSEFTIMNLDERKVEEQGKGTSYHNVREKAKKRLEMLGVRFKVEKRKKRPTKKQKQIQMSLQDIAKLSL
jgi:hypothetical protein